MLGRTIVVEKPMMLSVKYLPSGASNGTIYISCHVDNHYNALKLGPINSQSTPFVADEDDDSVSFLSQQSEDIDDEEYNFDTSALHPFFPDPNPIPKYEAEMIYMFRNVLMSAQVNLWVVFMVPDAHLEYKTLAEALQNKTWDDSDPIFHMVIYSRDQLQDLICDVEMRDEFTLYSHKFRGRQECSTLTG